MSLENGSTWHDEVQYAFFNHAEGVADPGRSREELQRALDRTTLLIAHNIKFDLQWLRECGFRYDGKIYDTMAGEYLLARGVKISLNLEESCIRRNCALKRKDLIDDYWKQGIGFYNIPKEVVEEYGRADVNSCGDLYLSQCDLYSSSSNMGLLPTLDLMNEFCDVLTEMERTGICIDLDELERITVDYQQQKDKLEFRLNELVHKLMGDTPINLASPEQLSQVIYSRRVKNKDQWAKVFNLGKNARGKPLPRPKLSEAQFGRLIREHTEVVRVTKAVQCDSCVGSGRIEKLTREGRAWKHSPKCTDCRGSGTIYQSNATSAGCRCVPRNVNDITANGFATDGDTLQHLQQYLAIHSPDSAERGELVRDLQSIGAIDTYLSSFCGGIRRGTEGAQSSSSIASTSANSKQGCSTYGRGIVASRIGDGIERVASTPRSGILRAKFNQCVAATGRLSSSEPNFQNLPRAKTFPIRRCIISRWAASGGLVLEGDFAQLEFRVAGELANDQRVLADLLAGHDVHAFTSQTLTDAGQTTDRQDAKPHTFKPLYGGTSGTNAEQTYYKSFLERYEDVKRWHEELLDTAVLERIIRIPSGREYLFPNAKRNFYGGVTGSTQIKNYPVQGFATADIVPIACIRFARALKDNECQSLLINTVHDSIVSDVYPGELDEVSRLLSGAMLGVVEDMRERYNYEFKFPLAIEIKVGPNWMEMKEIKHG